MIQLNYRDAKPIYEQIRDGIRRLLLLGAILPGEAMIPVRELSSKLAINPATIHRAYQELETEGYLYAESDGTIRVTDVRCEDGRKEELMEELDSVVEELCALAVPRDELLGHVTSRLGVQGKGDEGWYR